MLAWTAVAVPIHLVVLLTGKSWAVPPVYLAGLGRIAGLRLRIEGEPSRNALLLSNHLSWLDIPALAAASRSAFVAHSGLAGQPILKWLCEQNGTVFIARERRGSVAGQAEQLRQALSCERPLTVFLEGTCGDGRELLPFKSALLSAVDPLPPGIPVQPVALIYDEAPDIAWTGVEPGLDNAARILARTRPIRLTVRFLEPLAGRALADRKAMAAAAREAIAGELAR
ncbi:1-acyl-sn-glycerol-3-phosphate acyltransferase [Altererythrobacter soli]|uniref:1-acyl-sn-glycerol-3-phosphate acyltransferase n=2 Tax=Croceibacterium soli TaxID=1739690 RepID=A0A6I4UVF9_9SPHN|nr:1-acyl-sn-glycerol-3-phosphate acyltransferase [Croceibacterium soli]